MVDTTTTDVTYTRPVVRIEAVCTCGWHQLHENQTNATFDADRHAREWHGVKRFGIGVQECES